MGNDSDYDFRNFISLVLVVMWLRVFMVFRVSSVLGPLIKMFTSMLRDIATFLALYFISLFMFSAVGVLLFPDVEQFTSLYNAVYYLFEASLGNFDSSIFDQMITKDKEWG